MWTILKLGFLAELFLCLLRSLQSSTSRCYDVADRLLIPTPSVSTFLGATSEFCYVERNTGWGGSTSPRALLSPNLTKIPNAHDIGLGSSFHLPVFLCFCTLRVKHWEGGGKIRLSHYLKP